MNWKYVILIIAIIAVLAFLFIWNRKKSLSFDFNLDSNVANILNAVQGRYAMEQARINNDTSRGLGFYVDVPLTTIIKNNGKAATALKNVIGSLSYNGEPIIQTKPDSKVLQNVALAGRSSTPITDNVQMLVNPSSIKFLTELIQGKKPKVNYNFATTIAGKPYSFTNNTIVNKSETTERRINPIREKDLFIGSSSIASDLNCPDYSEKNPTISASGELVFTNIPNFNCPPCIFYQGSTYVLSSFDPLYTDKCYYKKK